MNKILLKDNGYEVIKSDNKIEAEVTLDYINKIKINVLANTKVYLIFDSSSETKYDITFNLMKNVSLNLIEVKKNNKIKILSKYNLLDKSYLNIIEVSDISSINERNIINLNGINSKVDVLLKTVSKNLEKYDYTINHNNKSTYSNITTQGVNVSGNLHFNVTTIIPNGNSKCEANQNNRIINLSNNECIIRPNLLIDEYDVVANHSALLGGFKPEEIFYINRLGISKDMASKLLIEGFLKSKLPISLSNNFKKYWR